MPTPVSGLRRQVTLWMRIETASLDALLARNPGAIQGLLRIDGECVERDIPVEVIAIRST